MSGAQVQHTDPVRVYSVRALEVLDHRVDVPHALVWVFHKVRFSFTSSLEGWIIGDGYEAGSGKFLRVYLGNLLLDPTSAVHDHQTGDLFSFVGGLEEQPCEGDRAFLDRDLRHPAIKELYSYRE